MRRKKPALKNTFRTQIGNGSKFWEVLELGFLLALKEPHP